MSRSTYTAGDRGNASDPARRSGPTFWSRIFYVWARLWSAVAAAYASTGYLLSHLVTRDPDQFRRWTRTWARLAFFGTRIRVQVEQRAPLKPDSAYVFVANHQNALDILLLGEAVPCPFGFVAKASLRSVPFIGWSLSISPSVFVDLRNPRRTRESIETAGAEIRAGRSVAIFAEGFRTQGPEMAPFKKTAFLLAVAAGVPIVPVTIVNAYEVLNESTGWARPGVVRVVLHEPVPTEGLARTDVTELSDRVFATVASELPERAAVPSS